MKKLLVTTSAMAMLAMSGAAFAQDADFTLVDDNANVTSGASLLSQVLSDAQDIQINMLNAAENLANLDGSINVLESANVDLLLQELTGSVGFGEGDELYVWELPDGTVQTGDQAAYELAVANNDTVTWTITGSTGGNLDGTFTGTAAAYNSAKAAADADSATTTAAAVVNVDLVEVRVDEDVVEGLLKGVSRTVDGTTAIDFFDPATTVDALQTDVKNLTTTVIGALNTGIIGQNDGTGSIAGNILTMANMELESVAQTTGSLAQSANYFEPGNLQLANIATNMATVVDASVNIDQLMANVDTVETTLIGALNTGDIAASVNQNASNLTQALVGQ